MSFKNVGKSWTRTELRSYLSGLARPGWAKGITLHNTDEPALDYKAWAKGWNTQLVRNMVDGYKRKVWDSGPHFYPDDHCIWGLTPPTEQGIHAKSFNRTHFGIEALGDFDRESPISGRGAKVWANTFDCAAEIMIWMGWKSAKDRINFHRDDPKTDKTCPGTLVSREWVLAGIEDALKSPLELVEANPAHKLVSVAEWTAARQKPCRITRDSRGLTMVNGIWIETAVYDRVLERTMASEKELQTDL